MTSATRVSAWAKSKMATPQRTSATRSATRPSLPRSTYQRVERMPKVAGWHAEKLLHDALLASDAWSSVGYGPGDHIKALQGRRVSVGDVDIAAFDRSTGKPIVASIKNARSGSTRQMRWSGNSSERRPSSTPFRS